MVCFFYGFLRGNPYSEPAFTLKQLENLHLRISILEWTRDQGLKETRTYNNYKGLHLQKKKNR